MTNEWKPGLPRDYVISARVEVEGEWYEVSTAVTREFLTDAVSPGPFLVDTLDRATAKAHLAR